MMSDQPPRWGELGYVPPRQPPKPKATLRPGQRRALWFALILAALGQAAYYVGFHWGGTVCDTSPLYDHPVVAVAGFLVSVGALAPVVPVVRSWSALLLPRFAIAVPILVALGLGMEIILPWGGACW
jgi:hypothetical protein